MVLAVKLVLTAFCLIAAVVMMSGKLASRGSFHIHAVGCLLCGAYLAGDMLRQLWRLRTIHPQRTTRFPFNSALPATTPRSESGASEQASENATGSTDEVAAGSTEDLSSPRLDS
jgi:hypothetical protein